MCMSFVGLFCFIAFFFRKVQFLAFNETQFEIRVINCHLGIASHVKYLDVDEFSLFEI